MAPLTPYFSFPQASYSRSTKVPTFGLPGVVCGTAHFHHQKHESMQMLKIVLQGKHDPYIISESLANSPQED